MCGGGGVEDNSAEVARIEAQEAERARQAAAEKEAQELATFNSTLDAVYNDAIGSARSFFQDQGLDPEQYVPSIQQEANSRRLSVPQLSQNPSTFFDGLGQDVFDNLQTGQRNSFLRDIDTFAGAGFARDRISDTVDDPIIAQVLENSFNDSKAYYDNLLERGVINPTAYDKALRDLGDQRGGASLKLEDIGAATLESGRGGLRDIASEARQGASAFSLGGQFDPFGFQQRIDTSAEDFLGSLSDRISGSAPSDLFDTSSLASLVGRSSGAQNTNFDLRALAGLDPEEAEQEDDEENIFASSAF